MNPFHIGFHPPLVNEMLLPRLPMTSTLFNSKVNHHFWSVPSLKHIPSLNSWDTMLFKFYSFHTDHSSLVFFTGSSTFPWPLNFGVPQKLILGPLLFSYVGFTHGDQAGLMASNTIYIPAPLDSETSQTYPAQNRISDSAPPSNSKLFFLLLSGNFFLY